MSVLNSLFSSAGAFSPVALLQPAGLNNASANPFGLSGGNNDSTLMMVLLLKSLLSDSGIGQNTAPTENIGLPLEEAPVATNATTTAATTATNAAAGTETANTATGITQPRSGDIALAGYPWLARSIDKARLKSEGKLDQLQLLFPCPQDQALHKKLGIDSEEFRQIVASSNSDEEVLAGLKAHGANIP